MRKYQPIWERIKSDGIASIIAPIESHARIIQAVRKEKWRDVGWRLLASERNTRVELQEEVVANKITFSLVHIDIINIHTL